jgi:hypothetical protein
MTWNYAVEILEEEKIQRLRRTVFELLTFRRADSKGGQTWHKRVTNF